jgi:hypothetical protein
LGNKSIQSMRVGVVGNTSSSSSKGRVIRENLGKARTKRSVQGTHAGNTRDQTGGVCYRWGGYYLKERNK